MSNNIIIKHCCCGSNFEQQEDVRWGNITGRIQDQGDLMDYINAALVGGDVDLQDYAKKDWVLEQIANIHIPESGITVAEVNVLIGNALDSYDTSSVVDEKVAQASAQTMQVVDSRGYLTEHQSLEGYATEDFVNQKISEIPTGGGGEGGADLSGYYTSAQTDEKIAQATAQTMQEVENKGYLTEHQDLSGKQDVIEDLDSIREGAEKGMTALQEHQSLAGYATVQYVQQQIALIPTGGTGGEGSTTPSAEKPYLLQGTKLVYFEIGGQWDWPEEGETYRSHSFSPEFWLNCPLVQTVKVNGRVVTEYDRYNPADVQAMDEVVVIEVNFNNGDLSSIDAEYLGSQLGAGVVFGTGITKLPENIFDQYSGWAIWQCGDELIPVDNGRGRGTIQANWAGDITNFFFSTPSSRAQAYTWGYEWSDGSTSNGWLINQEATATVSVVMPYVPNSSVVEVAYGYMKGVAERNYIRKIVMKA